ncbi:MAG: DMT family transporter [Bacillota bacterium]|nr:DMT family transporter [Bacillota bacterium]
MKKYYLSSNILLFITAIIWGFAFVAQRVGIQYMGTFTFNGIRFALGSLSLIPLILFLHFKIKNKNSEKTTPSKRTELLLAGIFVGLCLFFAATLQQIGLIETTAGKAAFITGLYIVLVPIFGIFLKHKFGIFTWIGAIIAVLGLYFLSVNERFSISRGDLYELAGAVLWSVHILLIDHFSRKVDVLKLACLQFFVCSALSIITALFVEKIAIESIYQARIPLLYGGLCSVGIAYTLQIVGQKNANPSHAAIILSLETVFAALGGFVLLNERLNSMGVVGCILMFSGMILSQIQNFRR